MEGGERWRERRDGGIAWGGEMRGGSVESLIAACVCVCAGEWTVCGLLCVLCVSVCMRRYFVCVCACTVCVCMCVCELICGVRDNESGVMEKH